MQLLDLIRGQAIHLLTLSAMNKDHSAMVGSDNAGHLLKPILPDRLKEHLAVCFGYSAGGPAVAESKDHRFALSALIVDDNLVNCVVAKGMLASFGVSGETTTDPQRALELLSQQGSSYALVFMDCEMPVMDGFEVTRKIRDLEGAQQLKANYIVALTAHVLPEYQRRAKDAGMDDFISKPLQKSELLTLLSSYTAGLPAVKLLGQTAVELKPHAVEE
jgi:CheY-like chemotaxis protein